MEQAAHTGTQTGWRAHGSTHLELLGARVLRQRRVASPRMLGYQRREREREQRTRRRRKVLKESDRGPESTTPKLLLSEVPAGRSAGRLFPITVCFQKTSLRSLFSYGTGGWAA